MIPHVTDEIKKFVLLDAKAEDGSDVDFVLVEIGGTVGDIRGPAFLRGHPPIGPGELPRGNSCFVHLTLLPFIKTAGEMKTKPTQHSVKELRSIGIQPDILLCRCEQTIPPGEKRKIALFCNVRETAVIQAMDSPSIYAVPLDYHREGLDAEVLSVFGMSDAPAPDLTRWKGIVERITQPDGDVTIAVVGKYTVLKDAYKSMIEALIHGGVAHNVGVNIDWVESEQLEARPARGGRAAGEVADGVQLVPRRVRRAGSSRGSTA